MKKAIILNSFIILSHLILSSSGGRRNTPIWEKENVSFPMMNQEIRRSMHEHDRQKELREKQTTNSATETINKTQWTKFKDTTVKIQDRLRIVDFAMQSIPSAMMISQEAKFIKKYQTEIIQEINDAPYSLVVALPKQVQFIDDLQMVGRLLTGIVVSYGAINQMEKAERKILLDYATQEVRKLHTDSYLTLNAIREMKRRVKRTKSILKNYINKDKQIVKDIMKNSKKF